MMLPYPRGGGMLRISSDGDDRMGAKTKTPINPRGKNCLFIIPYEVITNLHIVLNTPKIQATRKYTFQIFLPKKIQESKISNPPKPTSSPGLFPFFKGKALGTRLSQNPSIIPIIWNPEYPPPHLEPPMWVWNQDRPLGPDLRPLPQNCYMCQACETGPTVYRPYLWRRLERGSQWGGHGFYGYRLKLWFFYGYRLIFFSYG